MEKILIKPFWVLVVPVCSFTLGVVFFFPAFFLFKILPIEIGTMDQNLRQFILAGVSFGLGFSIYYMQAKYLGIKDLISENGKVFLKLMVAVICAFFVAGFVSFWIVPLLEFIDRYFSFDVWRSFTDLWVVACTWSVAWTVFFLHAIFFNRSEEYL